MENNTKNYVHKFEELLALYEDVCNWFDELGFSYTRHRYGVYKKHLENFLRMAEEKAFPKDKKDLLTFKAGFDSAYIEVHEIIRVYNGLKNIESSEFLEQIKKVASGREIRQKEGDDQARDFLFELSIAARFIKAGYSVSLTGVCDVVVDLGANGTLFVECKRIKSQNKIAANVKKANKQLIKRIKAAKTSKVRGLVAINVTDLLPYTLDLQPDSPQSVTYIHRGVSNKFTSDNATSLAEGMNRKCLGVMCESAKMQYFSKDADIVGFSCSRHTDYVPYYSDPLFKQLSQLLSNQDIK
ncbi:hypothetical protein ACS0KV_003412 [Vibrio alginolyticus]|uniref:hypothetical protein n=1 Tax=Vibrio alginolyticus TaxID=663 RepID=UPI0035523D56|nr:hypothetical protein [Vibrio alginolyticus]